MNGADHQRVGPVARQRREGGVDLAAVPRVDDIDLDPRVEAAAAMFPVTASTFALLGLTSNPIRPTRGTSSRNSASCFPPSSAMKKFTPVALPPGRARLSTD